MSQTRRPGRTFLPVAVFPFAPLSFAELTSTALSYLTRDCSGGIILQVDHRPPLLQCLCW